jgi:ADP-ribose pyrophosphatase
VDGVYYELPAGGVEKGDTVLSAAKKELEEETGYSAHKFKKIGIYAPMNGLCKEICTVFIASDLKKKKQKLESTEFIEVEEISIKKAYKMIDDNEIQCGMTLAAMSIARKHLEKYLK